MSSLSPASESSARSPALCASLVALLALTFGLYARTAGHRFVAFDDPVYLTENPLVARGLTLDGLAWAFRFQAGNWHPLTWLSHMLDVQLFGLEPGPHHLVNAALHTLNAALLYLLWRRLTGAGWTALLVAAWFALHPLRVESVAWASERKDVLGGTFWMLTLLAYERYARRGGVGRSVLLCACFALGLMAKSMLVTLPAVMLLLDLWPLERRRSRGLVLEKLPLFALALAAGAATFWIQQSEGAVGTLRSLSWLERGSNACLSYGVYVLESLWPASLACFVPHPVVVTPRDELARVLFWPGFLCLLALVLVTGLALWQRRARPHLLVGWSWYLCAALPVIGFVQVGQQAHADRYTYLPTIGLALALAFELRAWVARRAELRPLVVASAAVTLAALAFLSGRQIDTWKDSRTLFAHALAVTEHNYVAGTYLGMVERRSARLPEARAHLERALLDNKFHVPAMLELGLTLQELGDLPAARRALRRTLRNDPGNVEARRALAAIVAEIGDAPESDADGDG